MIITKSLDKLAFSDKLLAQLFSWKDYKWGACALICLYISLVSGVIIGLQYDYATPFYSTTSIDILVPYGEYFRSLHFFSSQFFFLLCCIHMIAVYSKSERYDIFTWIQLTTNLPIIVLLLFTGYVLRGDSTGAAAGMIAENIIQTIPFAGSFLNELFFSISSTGLRKIYLHHVIGLDLLLLITALSHIRLYRVKLNDYQLVLAGVLLFSMFIPAPLEPDHAGTSYISGPWFFLGLQELLRYIHPFIAGVITPLLFIITLFFSQPGYKHSRRWLFLGGGLLFLYSILTLIAWNR